MGYPELFKQIKKTDSLLAGFEQSTIARVEGALDAAFVQLEREFRRKWLSVENLDISGQDRAILLLEQIRQYLDLMPGDATEVNKLYEKLVADSAAAGVEFSAVAIQAVGGFTASTANPNLKAVAFQAQDAATRLKRHSVDFQLAASRVIEAGLVQGSGVAKVALQLRQQLGITKGKAQAIARTESMAAMDSATHDNYKENGISLVQRIGSLDDRLCQFCAARIGNVYELDKAPAALHPMDRCLPGFVVASSPSCPSATARHYKGQVVVIKTAAGNELTCTPNHPILTNHGWVAAHLIDNTFNVISCFDSEALVSIISPDKYYAPSPIREIFTSISSSIEMTPTSVKITPKDFHGDGVGSKIGVVYAHCLLADGLDPRFFEPDLKQLLGGRLAHAFFLFGEGGFLKIRQRSGSCSDPSHLDSAFFPQVLGHVRPNNSICLGLRSHVNPLLLKSNLYSSPGFSHRLGYLEQRLSQFISFSDFNPSSLKSLPLSPQHPFAPDPTAFLPRSSQTIQPQVVPKSIRAQNPTRSIFDRKPASVALKSKLNAISSQTFLDKVVSISFHDFCGEVYNLETSAGFYIAANIIVHNCFNSPFSIDWLEAGLVDQEWLKGHRAQAIAALGDKVPDYGAGPFERINNLQAPKAVWTVEGGLVNPPTKPAKAKRANKSPAKKTKSISDFPASLDGLKEIKKLGGSTGAVLVEDANGNRFVKKKGASADHLLEESRADNLYREMGLLVPEHKIYADSDGTPVKLARFVKGKSFGALTGKARQAAAVELQKGFAIDALMGNWDVLGLSGDNVIVDTDGKVWRVDNGGSLRYRAMGRPKDNTWNQYPTELWTLRDAAKNNTQAPSAFSGLDWYDVVEQIKEIKLPNFSAEDKALGDTLKARLVEMQRTANTSQTMSRDKWVSDYVEKFTKHGMGYRAAGIVEMLADRMDPRVVQHEAPFTSYLETPVDANGKPFDNIRHSAVAESIRAYYEQSGLDYEVVDHYRSQQGGASWSGTPLALKALIAKSRTVDRDTYYWQKGVEPADAARAAANEKSNKFDESLIAAHAWTYEQLSKIDMPNIDRQDGTIQLWRTEGTYLEELYGINTSRSQTIAPDLVKRGALESTSLFAPVAASAGLVVTTQKVPIHRVFADYMLQKTDSASGFIEDRENEATVILDGIEWEIRADLEPGHKKPEEGQELIVYNWRKGSTESKIYETPRKEIPPPTAKDLEAEAALDDFFSSFDDEE